MVSGKTSRLTLTDAISPMHSANKPPSHPVMRLDKLGFTYTSESFSFKLRDVSKRDKIYFETTVKVDQKDWDVTRIEIDVGSNIVYKI